VTSVAVSHDHQWVVSSADRSVRFWDLRTGEEQLILRGHVGEGTFQRICVCVRVTHLAFINVCMHARTRS
jgi:WD40 repeat protein